MPKPKAQQWPELPIFRHHWVTAAVWQSNCDLAQARLVPRPHGLSDCRCMAASASPLLSPNQENALIAGV